MPEGETSGELRVNFLHLYADVLWFGLLAGSSIYTSFEVLILY
jgi:hypothetical protein